MEHKNVIENCHTHHAFEVWNLGHWLHNLFKKGWGVFAIAFLCIIYRGFAQDDDDYSSTPIYTPTQVTTPSMKSPDVAAFQKVNFVPVSNYTGRATISIPIYEIVSGKMNVPISLSYNSSGVKVSDMPASVGSNWALNAGGMVSRNIKGLDDFKLPKDTKSHVNDNFKNLGWLTGMNPLLGGYDSLGDYDDYHPDLFTANAPGLSANYYHTEANQGGTPILFGDSQGIKINEEFGHTEMNHYFPTDYYFDDYGLINPIIPQRASFFGLKKTEITAINGLVYTFSQPNFSMHVSINAQIVGVNTSGTAKFESLQLEKIYDPSTGKQITFEYEQYDNPFFDLMDSGAKSTGAATHSIIKQYTQYLNRHRLKKIHFDKGVVQFDYDLVRTDLTNERALTSITIFDNQGNEVKRKKLEYGYFHSSIASHTSQSKRLRLDKVYEVDLNGNPLPAYELFYDMSTEMPPRNSYAHDYLGYNNGSYNPNLEDAFPHFYQSDFDIEVNRNLIFSLPNDNREISEPSRKPISPFNGPGKIDLGVGNYSLDANLEYAKAYSLNKMKYPTGGIAEYEYELNEFDHNGVTKKGGGLRLKSQKLTDEYGVTQIMDYTYLGGRINKLPSYADIIKVGYDNNNSNSNTLGLGITYFKSPNSQVELTEGAFVGYKLVVVKNRINNGYTKYQYTNPFDYPNKPSIKSEFSSEGVDVYIWGEESLRLDQDIYRGKLQYERVYDKDNNLVFAKEYEYTAKNFGSFSLSFFHKADPQCDPQIRDCSGFRETLAIPIERNVLSKVITKQYTPSFETYDDQRDQPEYDYLQMADIFETETTYQYSAQYPLITTEQRKIAKKCQNSDCGPMEFSETKKETTYAYFSELPFAEDLSEENRLSEVLSVKVSENGTLKAKEEKVYSNFEGKIKLEQVKFFGNDQEVSFSDKITKRGPNGEIVEYQHKDGNYTTHLYGYGGNYLVAEIKNARLSDVEAVYDISYGPINQGIIYLSSEAIKIAMNDLRETLPDARITSYTHQPLVGVTSITDPRGRTQTFHYDSFNRLQMIKDHEGNIISDNQYHYKNQ